MLKVICECGKTVDATVVGGQYQHTYEGTCECGKMWQLVDIINEQDEEEFYNIPEECEECECKDCIVDDEERREHDCPYLED